MARGDRLDARLLERIVNSPLSLTLHFPAVRQVATGVSPGSAPVSPLTRPGPTMGPTLTPETPSRAPVSMPCLWYAAHSSSQSSNTRNKLSRTFGEWIANADAIARVRCEDAGLEPGQNHGQSLFHACEFIEFQGIKYKMVAVVPVTSGWRLPVTLHVGLSGDVGG